MRNCRLHHSKNRGVRLEAGGPTLLLADSQVDHNLGPAIYQTDIDSSPVYHNLTLTDNGTDGVVVAASNVERNVTLHGGREALNGKPVLLQGSMAIVAGNTLTVTAGTRLKLANDLCLDIQSGAGLIAEGTLTQPITFTSQAATPQPGDWGHLWARSSAQLRLAHCDLGYGGQDNLYPILRLYSSDVQIRDCRVHHSEEYGVYLSGAGITRLLENSEIDHNDGYALYQTTADMIPTYRDLSLHDNGTDAAYLGYGLVQRNVTLDGGPGGLNGAPFVLAGVDVDAGDTLTIRPGTTLRFTAAAAVQVWNGGGLVAEGTATQPIIYATHQATPTPGY